MEQHLADFGANGSILLIGYGSVGQAILPLLLRHIKIKPENITVLERDDHTELFESRHSGSGVNYVIDEITSTNYQQKLGSYVGLGDMIINASLNIDAKSILEWCMQNGVMEIDTSLERWEHQPDETIPNLSERTLFHTHKVVREALSKYPKGPTCVVTHGANPGYVTHLTKRALLQLAEEQGKELNIPSSREEWSSLMQELGVKTIHIAERDTQIVDEPKVKNEFANTWSCEGFWAEGRAPSEMGFGTHEEKVEGLTQQGNSAFLNQPGVSVLMKSWVPKGGQYNGFLIQHSESVTISEYFSNEEYRPSVYYVYQPCDPAITSVHEMRGKELDLQNNNRILKNEIVSGIDELGVLLIGDTFCFWHGSQLSIERARELIPGESATSVQVAGSMLAAIVWMLKNPHEGYVEPEQIPFQEILSIGDHFWSPLASVLSNWTPNKDVNSLFYKEYDESNPCKFENFRVWT